MKYMRVLAAALGLSLLSSCGHVADAHMRSADMGEIHETQSSVSSTDLTSEEVTTTASSKAVTTTSKTTTAKTSTTTTATTTTTTSATTTTTASAAATTSASTTTAASETSVQTTASQTIQANAELEGDVKLSSNGKKIEVIEGRTYVDGILIVNKSYPLPSDYAPGGLLPEAQQAFNEFQSSAANDGVWLFIVSGFRSYEYQDYLYYNYYSYRGAETDRFSARAGHSEHQSGLAMDLNNASRSFVGTPEAAYIAAHCAEFGFIIRYPEDKESVTGFMYEPWHLRYVGKELAKYLTDNKLTLEEYLGVESVYNEDS